MEKIQSKKIKQNTNLKGRAKNLFAVFTLLLLTMTIATFSLSQKSIAYTSNSPELSVTFLNQDPDPAEPGNFFKARFKIENIGLAEARNIQFEITPQFPLSIYQDSTVKEIASISPRQKASEAVYIDYNLKVDSEALPGTHYLDIRYKIDDGSWVKLDPVSINLKQHDVIVTLKNVEFKPEVVGPGEKLNLKLTLQNLANTQVKYLTVKLGLVSVLSTTTSISKTELPFSPVSSTDTLIFPLLNPKQETVAEFNLIVDPDAASKVYKIPVTYTYTDPSNTEYSNENYISVIVGDVPDMVVNLENSKIYKSGMQGEVTVKFINKGLNDVKFLYAKLTPTEDYELLSPGKVYVGKVDSDDYSTVQYKIFVKESAKDKITLPLTLEYKDVNNNDYKKDASLEVKLYTTDEALKLGLEQKSNTLIYLIVLVVVIAVFIFFRIKRKKK